MTMHIIDLNNIAAHLEGLEETIIHKLIDRAQFDANPRVYQKGSSGFSGEKQTSLFDVRLTYQEQMDALFGRFYVPEERPFTAILPHPRRTVTIPPTGLVISDFDAVNLTSDIRRDYLAFVPVICRPGDDEQYGSASEHDVYALQAMARRIHYGALYVAESKYQSDPSAYQQLIDARDDNALLSLLTRPDVEHRILTRVVEKVNHLQAGINAAIRRSIDSDGVAAFYRDTIIPLTKKGQIRYLLNRKAAFV